MENDVKHLIDEFDDEKGFYDNVRNTYYKFLATSFDAVAEQFCNVLIFGPEYSLNARTLYDFDRHIAFDAWNNHVDQHFYGFHDWVNEVIWDDLEVFTNEFQQWLAEQDDEWVTNVIVSLMSGGIDLTKVTYEWLYDRLCREGWDYPA